ILPVITLAMIITSLAAMESNAMDVEQKAAVPTIIFELLYELENEEMLPHDVSLLILREYHDLQTLLESIEYLDVLGYLKAIGSHSRGLNSFLRIMYSKFGVVLAAWLFKIALRET